MTTSVLYRAQNTAEQPLKEFLRNLMSIGESLEERLEKAATIIGNSQLKLVLISRIGTIVITLDGTLKSVYLGRRESVIAEKTEDTFLLEIPHVPKECIEVIEPGDSNSMQYNGEFSGKYVIAQTEVLPSGLTSRGQAGKVRLAIWRISGDVGYLCLELSSPQ